MLLEGFFALLNQVLLFTSRIDNGNSFPNPLSAEKEREYLLRFRKEHDTEARNILVKHNLRLVVYITKKYVNYPDQDELISIGTMGLMKAIDTFDVEKGSQLATYASRCIENEILMTMRSYKKRANDVSIFESIGKDKEGNDLPIVDMLQTDGETVYERIEEDFLRKTIQNLIAESLDEREKRILTKRFGLDDNLPETQQQVADALHISRSYISRIEKKALRKLKEAIERENLLL